MDTRFVQSFLMVVELGSVAEAARRLNLTPAGVAQRVRALEAELGAALLTRVGRTVRPTEAGSAVYQRADGVLQAIRELKAAATLDVGAGEVRFGAISTALTGILPKVIKRMSELYPQIAIFVAPGTSVELYERVTSGDLDAAIVVEPPFPVPKECDWQLMREEPLALIAPGNTDMSDPHRLLIEQPFVRYDRNHWGGRLADSYLRHCGISPRDRFELDALEAIAVMVDGGLGISLVPDWAQPWPAGLSLAKWIIHDPAFTRRIGLIWNRSSLQLRLIKSLVQQSDMALLRGQHTSDRAAIQRI
jgi:DNA-binding transcriptional LysR family regulator